MGFNFKEDIFNTHYCKIYKTTGKFFVNSSFTVSYICWKVSNYPISYQCMTIVLCNLKKNGYSVSYFKKDAF